MSSFLYRVGRFAARRRWTVIVIWVAVVVGASALAGVLGNHLQSSFTRSEEHTSELQSH